MIELYHFESCPFCRKVREKLEALDLSYISHPSAQGSRKRDFLSQFVSEDDLQFPLLVDPERNVFMFESDEICKYLDKTYGK